VFSGTSAAHLERLHQGDMRSAVSDTRREIAVRYLELPMAPQEIPIPAEATVLERTPHIDMCIRELQRVRLGPYLPFGLSQTETRECKLSSIKRQLHSRSAYEYTEESSY
jgi:hypothetical protein